jgi:hypothetical protein
MSVSFRGSGGIAQALPIGGEVQTAVGRNTSTAAQVFAVRSQFEPVPGKLECTLTPTSANSIILVRAHIAWGGWTGRSSTDVGVGFRIYRSTKSASGAQQWTPHGQYLTSNIPFLTNNNSPLGVATGVYKYNQGDNNSSWGSDHILIADRAYTTDSTTFAVWWCCLYEAGSRTLYWNRSINTGNSYNPTHTCTITATELKA